MGNYISCNHNKIEFIVILFFIYYLGSKIYRNYYDLIKSRTKNQDAKKFLKAVGWDKMTFKGPEGVGPFF